MMRGVREIDKASVWAVFAQMRLGCFFEFVYELENTTPRSNTQKQLYACAREFLDATPTKILETIGS